MTVYFWFEQTPNMEKEETKQEWKRSENGIQNMKNEKKKRLSQIK